MDNFKSSVPAEVQTKIKALAELILSQWGEVVNKRECVIRPEVIQEIEGNSRSGWIPHQDGGFTVSGYYSNDADSSYHFTENQTEFANEQQDICFRSFLADNELFSETQFDALTEEQRESLYDYEREWFEEALLQFQIFADGFAEWKKEKPSITVRVSINYKDAPYYRESYAEDIKHIGYTLEEFMALDNAAIVEEFTI